MKRNLEELAAVLFLKCLVVFCVILIIVGAYLGW